MVAQARTAEASHLGWPTITGMLLQNSSNDNRPLDGRPGYDPFDGTDPSYSCDGADTGGLYHDCGYPGIGDGPRFTTIPQLEAECRQEAASSKATPAEGASPETEPSEGTPSEGPSRPKKSSLEPLLSRLTFPTALDSSALALPSGLPASCATKYEQTDLVPANIGHNELLGGDGNDTIHAGPAGDVIWGTRTPKATTRLRSTASTVVPATTGSTQATAPTTSGPVRARTTCCWSTAMESSTATAPGARPS